MKALLKKIVWSIFISIIWILEKTGFERKYKNKWEFGYFNSTKIRIIHPVGFIVLIGYIIWCGIKDVKEDFTIF